MYTLTQIPQSGIQGARRARNAHARNNVDERVRNFAQEFQATLAGGGGDERDVREAFTSAILAELDGFLGRQVADNEAVDAGGFAVLYELLFTVGEDGVVVAHEEDGDGEALRACINDDFEGSGYGNAVEEGDGVSLLDGGAVGDGVGERETELDEVWG